MLPPRRKTCHSGRAVALQQMVFQLLARMRQPVHHVERKLVLIGGDHLQVDNHPQQCPGPAIFVV